MGLKRRGFLGATALGMSSLAGCFGPEKLDVETTYDLAEGITVALEKVVDLGLWPFDGCSVTITIGAKKRGEYWVRVSGINQQGVALDDTVKTIHLYEDEEQKIYTTLHIHPKKLETVRVQAEPFTIQPTEEQDE